MASDYTVVSCDTAQELATAVEAHMRKGWSCQGGVCVFAITMREVTGGRWKGHAEDVFFYTQAMVK